MSLLRIRNLKISFPGPKGLVRANNLISLDIKRGEVLGLIGETGCGKTVLGKAIMGLLPENALVGGEILYNGFNLLDLPENKMRRIRGRKIAMMLQNSSLSLNPALRIGDQITEIYRHHDKLSKKSALEKASDILMSVGIRPDRMNEYPHQFSGGMKQRIMIAISFALNPKILIADEPTTGLDVNVKNQIMDLMGKLRSDKTMLLITHDLDIAEKICDRIAVMYAGEIIEIGSTKQVVNDPMHPYTIGLLNSSPKRGLKPINGMAPSLVSLPHGCKFQPRCGYNDGCSNTPPEPVAINDHWVRCHIYNNDKS